MFYVYILYSKKTNTLYKGFTRNLDTRIKQHKTGKVTSTKRSTDWQLVYYQVFINETDARKEEKFLKTGSGRERLRKALENTLTKLNNGSVVMSKADAATKLNKGSVA